MIMLIEQCFKFGKLDDVSNFHVNSKFGNICNILHICSSSLHIVKGSRVLLLA